MQWGPQNALPAASNLCLYPVCPGFDRWGLASGGFGETESGGASCFAPDRSAFLSASWSRTAGI